MSGTTEHKHSIQTKKLYYIPVGNIPKTDEEIEKFLKETVNKFRRDSDGTIKLKGEE